MKPITFFTAIALLMLAFSQIACTPNDPNPEVTNELARGTQEVNLDTVPGPKNPEEIPGDLAPTSAEWKSTKQDFGTVALKTELLHRFTVKNTGTEPLKLIGVKPSCQCTATDWTKEEIAPGGEGFVEASYTPDKQGTFTKTVTVTTNTPERNYVLTLAGEGK